MEKNLFRSLTVLADGEQVTGFCYARLTGREALGLLPLPYTLRLLNLPDSGTGLLYAARNLSVLRDGSLLAWGRVSAVLRRTVPEGMITVDAGAENALRNRGASLLPSGITAVSGNFMRGADVIIAAPDGREIARGFSRYDSSALDRIKRHGSDEIEGILGYENGSVAVHRDDMVITG